MHLSLRFPVSRIRMCLTTLILLFLGQPGSTWAIIEGEDAVQGEFPATAAIIQKGSFANPAVIGGGVLIREQWVLTAAHSLILQSSATIEVHTGVADLTNPIGLVTRNVLAIIVHPDFVQIDGTSENDAALLLLDRPIPGAATLPIADRLGDLPAGTPGTVVGWGTTEAGVPQPSPILQKGGANIVENSLASTFFPGLVNESHVAARDPSVTTSPCIGDSGGPLIIDIDGVPTVAGLVSFGIADCSDASVPAVYTSMPEAFSWIAGVLSTSASPSAISLTGRNRIISNGDLNPRRLDSTDFGSVRARRGMRTRTFFVQNESIGFLTVPS
ncbi:MAG: serine protease, partial [Verrucomicrobiota bacterium]